MRMCAQHLFQENLHARRLAGAMEKKTQPARSGRGTKVLLGCKRSGLLPAKLASFKSKCQPPTSPPSGRITLFI